MWFFRPRIFWENESIKTKDQQGDYSPCLCVCKNNHVSLSQSVHLFWLDSCVGLLWAQCSYSTSSPTSLLAQFVLLWPPHQHTTPPLPHKDIREVSSSVPGGQIPLLLHPCGLLGVVTVGLFRMLTPVALWAGSALTKVKPLHMPLHLHFSHTHSGCTLESEG